MPHTIRILRYEDSEKRTRKLRWLLTKVLNLAVTRTEQVRFTLCLKKLTLNEDLVIRIRKPKGNTRSELRVNNLRRLF